MNTRTAVATTISALRLSKYALAKSLGAFPISVDHWLAGAQMSEKYRLKMKEVYGVVVDDTV